MHRNVTLAKYPLSDIETYCISKCAEISWFGEWKNYEFWVSDFILKMNLL